MTDLARRLRRIRDENNWTAADMAERSSIPKRTMEKYMLRDGASLPGFEALALMSKGFGVSLDWLFFGDGVVDERTALLVERATYDAAYKTFDLLVEHFSKGTPDIYKDGEILQHSPEEWALHIAHQAKVMATGKLKAGTSTEALLTWKAANSDMVGELMNRKFERFSAKTKVEGS